MHRLPIVLLLMGSLAAAQPRAKNLWPGWNRFLGTWQGIGGGGPGHGAGEFSFEPALSGSILIRHNFAEYPASPGKPAYRHDDLMVIYHDATSRRTLADYWDSEGHVILYVVELSEDKLIFVSETAQAEPRYRLTYWITGKDTLKLRFEIAPPPDQNNFKTYIEASAQRKPDNNSIVPPPSAKTAPPTPK